MGRYALEGKIASSWENNNENPARVMKKPLDCNQGRSCQQTCTWRKRTRGFELTIQATCDRLSNSETMKGMAVETMSWSSLHKIQRSKIRLDILWDCEKVRPFEWTRS